ncbi:MAG: type IV secretion protein IcmD [Legionellales bacterium]|nr:type IV secretion protein IcmD [Legionellales bacterium]|tara:strand:- start:8224 stop:8628 length:405 start_codon:yes stop_codon:yes gene_type:complete
MAQTNKKHWLKIILMTTAAFSCFFVGAVFAQDTQGTIAGIASNVKDSFGAVAQLITAGAYIMGMGFVLGAIFKFKAHKDNPTQVQIGGPIALLFIGAGMLFLPTVFSVTGKTIFGQSGKVGGVTGVSSFGSFSS